MKRAISILLACMLMLSMTTSALANRMPAEDRMILFGKISVKGAGDDTSRAYRGARDDQNDIVYIHAYDLMDILGAEIIREGEGENCILHYWVGNWHAEVRTESGACVLTYRLKSAYGGEQSIPYGRYELTDCLYAAGDDAFYLPFEQMLYLFAAVWFCDGGTVVVERPETFLDVLAGFDGLFNEVPTYEELMGQDWKTQLANSVGLGIGATMDEIDLQFVFDGAVSAFLNTSSYQQKSMQNALMLMMMDSAAGEAENAEMLTGADSLEALSTYSGMIGSALEITQTEEAFLQPMLDGILKIFSVSAEHEKVIRAANAAKPGVPVVSYLLSVLQVYSTAARMEESLKDRLDFIEEVAGRRAEESEAEKEKLLKQFDGVEAGDFALEMARLSLNGMSIMQYLTDFYLELVLREDLEENIDAILAVQDADGKADYFSNLQKVTAEVRELYLEDTSKAFKESVNIDSAIGLVDAVISIAGGTDAKGALKSSDEVIEKAAESIVKKLGTGKGATAAAGAGSVLGIASYAVGWAALTAGTIDLVVEVSKLMIPQFRGLLEGSENAHTCVNLIYISNMLKKEFEAAYNEISTGAFTRETLENARMSAHLLAVASLHAHEILEGLGAWTPSETGYQEPAYIQRLMQAASYDKLLMMDEGFINLVSDENGCVRQEIPVSYVRIGGKVFVTTETYTDSGEHFSARIVRPRVYAEDNPDLTAMIDAELDKLYTEKFAGLEERKAGAAACKSDMQTHTETLTLTSAYSNGGFVTFSLQSGYFLCAVGHDCNETFTYIFDIATGEKLEFEDLLDLQNNPQAKDAFIAMIGRELERNGYSDSKAGKIYSEMLKDEVARWDITPQGIKVLIDVMYFDLFGCGTMLMPYEELGGILKEEYLPQETVGRMYVSMDKYDAAAVDEEDLVYSNTPAAGMVTLMGVADHVWVGRTNGQMAVDGKCSYFYAYAPGNSLVTLPYTSTTVAWIDEAGEHIEELRAPK